MESTAPGRAPSHRKRAVNLTLSAGLVDQAKVYTDNLSATVEQLLSEYVAGQRQAALSRRQCADAAAAEWNSVHDALGSFADDHSTL